MYFSYFQLIFGNTNDETHNVIRRDLDSPIHAEKVRFIPKTWQRVPCLRVELCGEGETMLYFIFLLGHAERVRKGRDFHGLGIPEKNLPRY